MGRLGWLHTQYPIQAVQGAQASISTRWRVTCKRSYLMCLSFNVYAMHLNGGYSHSEICNTIAEEQLYHRCVRDLATDVSKSFI
jgi:hypothetical protein